VFVLWKLLQIQYALARIANVKFMRVTMCSAMEFTIAAMPVRKVTKAARAAATTPAIATVDWFKKIPPSSQE
jgi:hypothetical protein